MQKKRTIFTHPAVAIVAGALLNAYYELVLRTSRVQVLVDYSVQQLVHEQAVPVIYALWHSHLFFLPLLRRYENRSVAVLISAHRDARIAGVAARLRGVQLVMGSSTRGGVSAYRQLRQCLQGGQSVVITPDGPKGPPRKVKPGVIKLALDTRRAVVPVALKAIPAHSINSWDRTIIPVPFGSYTLTLGKILYLDRHGDYRQGCLKIEELLNGLY